MPVLLLKLAPYLGVLLVGLFLGYRLEVPAVQKAKLALAAQHTVDAQEAAQADAKVVRYQAALATVDDEVMAGRQALRQARVSASEGVRATIARQAAQAGQDAPVAPVLASALATMKANHEAAP